MADLIQTIGIDAPRERVWAEVTRREAPQRWLLDSVLDSTLLAGDSLAYRSPDGKLTFIVGRIVDVVPPERFAHTFRLTNHDDPSTLVTWTLEPEGEGTRVTIRHTGWPADAKGIDRADRTWAGALRELKALLETGAISRGATVRQGAMRLLGFAAPRRVRTGNVDPESAPTELPEG